eukprot:gene6759-9261_t
MIYSVDTILKVNYFFRLIVLVIWIEVLTSKVKRFILQESLPKIGISNPLFWLDKKEQFPKKLFFISKPRSRNTAYLHPTKNWIMPIIELNALLQPHKIEILINHKPNIDQDILFENIENYSNKYDNNMYAILTVQNIESYNLLIQTVPKSILTYGLYDVCFEGNNYHQIIDIMVNTSIMHEHFYNSLFIDFKTQFSIGNIDNPWDTQENFNTIKNRFVRLWDEYKLLNNIQDKQVYTNNSTQIKLFLKPSSNYCVLCVKLAMGMSAPLNSGQGGREPLPLAKSARRPQSGILKKLTLQKLTYVSPTAMQPELGFLMTNLASISTMPSCINSTISVLDPFCGCGSLLVVAAIQGAKQCVGIDANPDILNNIDGIINNFKLVQLVSPNHSDCDFKVSIYNGNAEVLMHNNTADSSSLRLVRTQKFQKQFGSYSFYDDLTLSQQFQFDAIITDLPYGMHESYQTLPSRNNNFNDRRAELDEETIRSVTNPVVSVIKIAEKYLRTKGKLVFFASDRDIHRLSSDILNNKNNSNDGFVDIEDYSVRDKLNSVSCNLSILFIHKQDFSPTFSRYLCCMAKLS